MPSFNYKIYENMNLFSICQMAVFNSKVLSFQTDEFAFPCDDVGTRSLSPYQKIEILAKMFIV
jgi:hypothetical protein